MTAKEAMKYDMILEPDERVKGRGEGDGFGHYWISRVGEGSGAGFDPWPWLPEAWIAKRPDKPKPRTRKIEVRQ